MEDDEWDDGEEEEDDDEVWLTFPDLLNEELGRGEKEEKEGEKVEKGRHSSLSLSSFLAIFNLSLQQKKRWS